MLQKQIQINLAEKLFLNSSGLEYSNLEKILSKNNEVIECECGKTYTRANKARHLKTHKS